MKNTVKTMVTLVMVMVTGMVGVMGMVKIASNNVQTNPNQKYFEQLSYGGGTVVPMPNP